MARQRNTLQLPTIRSSAGLRLPPDRFSTIACNFHLKSAAKKVCNDAFHFLRKFHLLCLITVNFRILYLIILHKEKTCKPNFL